MQLASISLRQAALLHPMQIPNQDTSFTGDLKQFALDLGCGSGAVADPAP